MAEKGVKHSSIEMTCVFGGKAARWRLQLRAVALAPSGKVRSRLQ